jgi:hypothetical protein
MRLKVGALAFQTMMRGLHSPMSWQLDGIFSLRGANVSLVSLVPSNSPLTRHDESQLANDAELIITGEQGHD